MRAKIPGVNTVRKVLADGSVRTYYYHRDTGTRLEGEPGSSIFVAAYAKAEVKLTEQHAGSCSGLIRTFVMSPEFKNNSPAHNSEGVPPNPHGD
jgi:hypothetical protein